MTDYTKSTNFASKDSLSSGDPLKIVKGTEINTEFDNIATAVATKANTDSPTFTGTPAAPTASAGTNTTQLSTTAFVTAAITAALQVVYPVGSIYSNISASTNPATLFGFGTWVALEGVTIIGRSSTDSTFGTAGSTGGSKDAVIPSHTHTATDSGHSHGIAYQGTLGFSGGGGYAGTAFGGSPNQTTASSTANITVSTTGVSATNANLPPYVVAYVWKRTA
jgi:hypothetical protein